VSIGNVIGRVSIEQLTQIIEGINEPESLLNDITYRKS